MASPSTVPKSILREEDHANRYVLFPINPLYKEAWEMYQEHRDSRWTVANVDMSKDRHDFETRLNNNERWFIKMMLAFFAAADGIVLDNLFENFPSEVFPPEIRAFYSEQNASETIHTHNYSLLIETIVSDPEEKKRLFEALKHFESVKRKAGWARKWVNRDRSFAERLVAFACVEGIHFSAAFCSIYYIKYKHTDAMPGLVSSNEYIARDEAMHTDFACLLYEYLLPEERISEERIREIVTEAVDIERVFVRDALPVRLIGMNAESMIKYIEFVADRLLLSLGCDKVYNAENPFADWMEMISMDNKTNFFEKRVTEYGKFNSVTDADFESSDED